MARGGFVKIRSFTDHNVSEARIELASYLGVHVNSMEWELITALGNRHVVVDMSKTIPRKQLMVRGRVVT